MVSSMKVSGSSTTTPVVNGLKMDLEKQVVECELYNFGHAPFEVIQKFQDFCLQYNSLTEALIQILSREPLLKRKYHFIAAPVMYQMLAKPTEVDSGRILDVTIDALKKFTRRGRYDSVSNAIEELLLSPEQNFASDKATWTDGNVGNNYTELSQMEQDVLEKIADTLIFKLGALMPEPKKRRSTSKQRKESPKKRKSNETSPLQRPVSTHIETQNPELCKSSSSHLFLNVVHQNDERRQRMDSIDTRFVIPFKNLVEKRGPVKRCHKDVSQPLSKDEFVELMYDLLPVDRKS